MSARGRNGARASNDRPYGPQQIMASSPKVDSVAVGAAFRRPPGNPPTIHMGERRNAAPADVMVHIPGWFRTVTEKNVR